MNGPLVSMVCGSGRVSGVNDPLVSMVLIARTLLEVFFH